MLNSETTHKLNYGGAIIVCYISAVGRKLFLPVVNSLLSTVDSTLFLPVVNSLVSA